MTESLINRALDTLHQLRRLESMRKLNSGAFMAEALAVADCTPEDVAGLERTLAAAPDCAHVHAMIRNMIRAMREPYFSRPFPKHKAHKALTCYGSQEAGRQLAALGMTVAQAQALAVSRLVTAHGDTAFGTVGSFPEHEAEIARLRAELAELYQQIKASVSAADLIFSHPPLPPLPPLHALDPGSSDFRNAMRDRAIEEDRRSRLQRSVGSGPWLRDASHISVATDDWPARLVEYLLDRQTGAADPIAEPTPPATDAEIAAASKPKPKKPAKKKRKRVKTKARQPVDESLVQHRVRERSEATAA